MDERIVKVLNAMLKNTQALARYDEQKSNLDHAEKLWYEALGYWTAIQVISDPEFLERMCKIHNVE